MRVRSRRARLNALGLLVALVTLFPIFWMVSTAFKPATEIYSLTPHPLPAHPTLANFRTVIDGSVIGIPYWNFLKNSLFVTLVSVAASTLIALLAAIALPVTIWMLRNFVAAVPREMEEAAAIDGAGPVRVFWHIMLPLVAPGLVATRPDLVVVEMGPPRWQPPGDITYLATYGASRANAQAAAELLGLV